MCRTFRTFGQKAGTTSSVQLFKQKQRVQYKYESVSNFQRNGRYCRTRRFFGTVPWTRHRFCFRMCLLLCRGFGVKTWKCTELGITLPMWYEWILVKQSRLLGWRAQKCKIVPACVTKVSNNFNHTVAKYVRFVANLLCQLCVYICVSMCQTCTKRVSKPVPTTCQLVSKYIKLLPNLCQHCVKIVSTVVSNCINMW